MIEERITTLEAECADNTAALAKLEISMNDRFQQIDEQLAELRRSKAGVELREDIDRRFYEQREYLKVRFEQMNDRFEFVSENFRQADQRFIQVDKQFDQVYIRFDQVDRQFVQVNRQFVQVDRQFDQVYIRFDQVDKQFDGVYLRLDDERKRHEQSDKRLDRIETEMSNLGREMRSFTRWVIGSQIGVAMAILVMATKLYFG